MPRGDKDKYTDKQKRKAEHIEESYEHKGVPKDQAEARAWATVNKQSGGGEKKVARVRLHPPARRKLPGRTRPNGRRSRAKVIPAHRAAPWKPRASKA